MAKKQGKINKKGLKGALARHTLNELTTIKKNKALESAIDNQKFKEKSKSNGNTKARKGKQIHSNQRGIIPFQPDNRVMLIGEGDFSYAVSIIKQGYILPKNLIATSYDNLNDLNAKYPNIDENLDFLQNQGVKIFHEIDANDLIASFKIDTKKGKAKINEIMPKLDFIMFNFPHTGKGIKDVDRNIREHQKLMVNYFKSCKQLFSIVNDIVKDDFAGYSDNDDSRGKVLVTVFEGEPYNSWQIKMLARSENWKVEKSGRFEWELVPEYHHRRTNSTRDTTKPAQERDARTYVFENFRKKENPTKEDESDSD